MKLQFDANQPYLLDAIAAVVDLFDGQPQGAPLFSVIRLGEFGELFAGQERTENGVGNRLLLDEATLRANTRAIQTRNEVADPGAALESWELFDAPANAARTCPHLLVTTPQRATSKRSASPEES
jgi:type III restriction enzyme